jgi:hypothetical protein
VQCAFAKPGDTARGWSKVQRASRAVCSVVSVGMCKIYQAGEVVGHAAFSGGVCVEEFLRLEAGFQYDVAPVIAHVIRVACVGSIWLCMWLCGAGL